jgi:hypothetical protein
LSGIVHHTQTAIANNPPVGGIGSTAWDEAHDVDALAPSGLTGATAASRYVGATTGGAPTSGTFSVGDYVLDRTGKIWVCVTAGTPGSWIDVGASPLDQYPMDATYGDHFTGAALDAKWTRRNYTSGAESYQQGKNATYLRIAHASRVAGDGYFQDATSLPDGTYAMAFVPHFYQANGMAFGIAILDSAGTGIATILYNAGPQALILGQVTTFTTYGGSYVQVGASGTAPNVSVLTNGIAAERKIWIYIVRSGTSHKIAMSLDGEIWTPESGSLTWSGTPRYIGMFQGPLGTVTTGVGLGTYADVDWFNKIA